MQADKMREALNVIAEVRGSSRIRQFLETGRDRKCNVLLESHML